MQFALIINELKESCFTLLIIILAGLDKITQRQLIYCYNQSCSAVLLG